MKLFSLIDYGLLNDLYIFYCVKFLVVFQVLEEVWDYDEVNGFIYFECCEFIVFVGVNIYFNEVVRSDVVDFVFFVCEWFQC